MQSIDKNIGNIFLSNTRSSGETEPRFPDNSDSNVPNVAHMINDESNKTVTVKSLEIVLAEGIIKCISLAYMAVGIVHGISYFICQILCGQKCCPFLKYTSYICFAALIIEVCLAITFKIILIRQPAMVKLKNDKSWALFYGVIIVTGIIACIDTVFELIEDIENDSNPVCAKGYNGLITVSHAILIILSLLLTHNFTSNEISNESSCLFYFAYKASMFLLIMICIRWTIMEIVLTELRFFLKLKPNLTLPYFECYNNSSSYYETLSAYTKLFAIAFPSISASVILPSIQRMPDKYVAILKEEKQPLLSQMDSMVRRQTEFYIPKNFSTIIFLFFVCLAISLASAIVDVYSTHTSNELLLLSSSLSIPFCIISSIIAVWMLTICVNEYNCTDYSKVPILEKYIIWIFLLGHFINCIKYIWASVVEINSKQCLQNNDAYFVMAIVTFSMSFVEGGLHAILLDFIIQVDIIRSVSESVVIRLYYLCFPFIGINIGYVINLFIMFSGLTTFPVPKDIQNGIIWYVLTSISCSSVLLFKGVCVFFIVRFLWRIQITS